MSLHIYTGGLKIPTPQIIGHKFAEEVSAVGSGVKGIEVGERVTAEHVIACKKCRYCEEGEPNLCVNTTIISAHLPGGMGVDVAFEVVGREETAEQALEITRKSGFVVLVGLYEGLAILDIIQIIRKELKVIRSWTESLVFDKTIALLADGRIKYTDLSATAIRCRN